MKSGYVQSKHEVPLTPAVFHVLLALAEGEMHGYGIMQDVARISGGRLRMGPGTLYGTLKRMLEAKLIVESDERPDPALDDERRRYYRLTDFGSRVAAGEAQRLSKLLQTARKRGLTRAVIPKPGYSL